MGTAALRWGCRPYAMPLRGLDSKACWSQHPWEAQRGWRWTRLGALRRACPRPEAPPTDHAAKPWRSSRKALAKMVAPWPQGSRGDTLSKV
jgi:hypothetical protein